LAAAQQLKADRPTEIGFAPDVGIVIQELHEGKEPSAFFRGEFYSVPLKLKDVIPSYYNAFATVVTVSSVAAMHWLV
jgi:hypothetical protein